MSVPLVEEPRTILVRGANWLGDVVMATPAFRALRAGFPRARITLHLREAHHSLLGGAPWFDEILPVTSYGRGLGPLFAEACALRSYRFDLGICMPDSMRAALLMRAAGVGRVVGYRGRLRGRMLHMRVPPPGDGLDPFLIARELHELGLVEALGCPSLGTGLELFTTPLEEAEAQRALEEGGLDVDRPLVVLAPGASFGSSKIWPPSYFARVGDGLAAQGACVALLGAPEERPLAEEIRGAMAAHAVNLAGAIGLGATKALIARARLLVCNDAGARHIAVAFGVPCVVLMGPTALEKTNLNLEQVSVLTADDVDCRPCYKRVCPIDHRCMTRISPERVLAVAQPILQGD